MLFRVAADWVTIDPHGIEKAKLATWFDPSCGFVHNKKFA